ncbi:MAG: hypothetical protein DRJ63_02970 [Thermoprotei archaeon]|nr:MAG: hypothetical protein DRJ63_02970 [Thermoprotei archaeon]
MKFLEVRSVFKSYGSIRALRGVSISVDKGEYLCILGPTGAGKTTLLKIIAGLIKPDRGRVLIEGFDVTDLPPELRSVSYMPQGYALFPHMSVWDNVSYGLRVRGLPLDRAEEALKMVGLYHRRFSRVYELSGGQQQRVALARAIAAEAKLLLLDEPLSALDALLNLELRHELRRLAKGLGLTVLHVTHNTEEALSIADRVVILRKGVVQQVGRPSEIYLKPANIFTASFLSEVNILEGLARVSGEKSVVDVRGLGKLVLEKPSTKASHVVVIYRPEDVLVSSNTPSYKVNVFKGEVRSIEFLGLFSRLRIQVNGLEIIADLWSGEDRGLKEDSRVYVYFDPRLALVYPYPREGLHVELYEGGG